MGDDITEFRVYLCRHELRGGGFLVCLFVSATMMAHE